MILDKRYVLWKRTALLLTLVPLSVLIGAPYESVFYVALGSVATVLFGFLGDVASFKLFRVRVLLLFLLLAGVLTGLILQSQYSIHADKSYVLIMAVVFLAFFVDELRTNLGDNVSFGFVGGIVYSLGMYLYILLF